MRRDLHWMLLVVAMCATMALGAAAPQRGGPSASVPDRPMTLPTINRGDPCPVTQGSLASVPPSPHIFGSGGVWFGDGPVYLNFAWKADRLPPARFSLQPIQVERGTHRAKTPVVAESTFAGPILIRGRSLAPDGARLLFGGFGSNPQELMALDAPHDRPSSTDWSFWAISLAIPMPGCYGLQIDTPQETEVVILEAIP